MKTTRDACDVSWRPHLIGWSFSYSHSAHLVVWSLRREGRALIGAESMHHCRVALSCTLATELGWGGAGRKRMQKTGGVGNLVTNPTATSPHPLRRILRAGKATFSTF
jgi:hypothetical protein